MDRPDLLRSAQRDGGDSAVGHVEAIAGVNLPMLVRALTYRTKDLETMVRKAVSGGCEGVLHLEVDPRYAAARG